MDIDLIPSDYRARLWRLSWLKGCATALGGIVVTTLLAYLALEVLEQVAAMELSALQQHRDITSQQQTLIDQLTQEKLELERQWRLLNDLKRGTDAEGIFRAIDTAFTDDSIWFDKWEFNRSGVTVRNADQKRARHAVAISSAPGAADGAMRLIETHMTISGDALDHVALANFVRRLLAQPQIADVKVRRTSRRQIRELNVVAFDLSLLVEPLESGSGFLGAL
ncbi:MAG: hypothetical protein V3U43_05890 [Pseudomonadales bacterium]